jgi:hypothetical protein
MMMNYPYQGQVDVPVMGQAKNAVSVIVVGRGLCAMYTIVKTSDALCVRVKDGTNQDHVDAVVPYFETVRAGETPDNLK